MNAKLFIAIFFVFTSIQVVYAKIKVSLQKAYDKKMITAAAICKGGLELNYRVSNLLKDSLEITIPAGWRFNSDGGKQDYQDIFITHDRILAMKPKETKNFDVKGYCCEATKGGPQKGVSYTLGKMADSSLVKLARYLNVNPVDANTEQYSVWAISDGQETANITSHNDSMAALVRSFVSVIKNEPLPWYTLLKKGYVSSSGQVHDYPVRFKADINYSVSKTCYSYCYIVNSKGETVSEIFGTWLQPQDSDYKASFNVAALPKGDYNLVLEGKDLPIFKKEFKI